MEERKLRNSTETKELLQRCDKIRAQLKGINCHWLKVCAGDRLYWEDASLERLSARPHARKECVYTFQFHLRAHSIKRCYPIGAEHSWPKGLARKSVCVARDKRKPSPVFCAFVEIQWF